MACHGQAHICADSLDILDVYRYLIKYWMSSPMKKKQVFSGGTCQSADIAASVYVLRNELHS